MLSIVLNWAKHALIMLPAKVAAPFVVPFLSKKERWEHDVWGADDATDLSWWNIGVRNSTHNYNNKPTPEYKQLPEDLEDETLEQRDGFQWRVRISKDNPAHASFRMSWGKIRPKKGKKELYTGWTMDKDRGVMGFSIIQLRMTWEWLIPAGLIIYKVFF